MLKREASINDSQFSEALERYLGELLHERIYARPFEGTHSLPSGSHQIYFE